MQIHEITKQSLREGFIDDLKQVGSALKPSRSMGSGFVQGLTGAEFRKSREPVDLAAAAAAVAAATPATERIVVSVSQPDQTVPAKYFKTKDVWTNEDGKQITNPKSIAYLDKLIPTHGKKETIAPPITARKVSRRRTAR
jgi:hypothetical protein